MPNRSAPHFIYMNPRNHGSIFDHDWLQTKQICLTHTPEATIQVPAFFLDCDRESDDDIFRNLPRPPAPAVMDRDGYKRQPQPNPVRRQPEPAPQAKRNHGSIYGNEWQKLKALALTNTPKPTVQVPLLFLDCERESEDDIFMSRQTRLKTPDINLVLTSTPKATIPVPPFYLNCDRECEDDIFQLPTKLQPSPKPTATPLFAFNGELCGVYSSGSLRAYAVAEQRPRNCLDFKLQPSPEQLVCIGNSGFVWLTKKKLFYIGLDAQKQHLVDRDVRCLRSDPSEKNAFLYACESRIVRGLVEDSGVTYDTVMNFDAPVESFSASRVNLAVSFEQGGTRSLRLFSRICAYKNAEIASVSSIGTGTLFCDDSACYTISGKKVECVWGEGVSGSLAYSSWASRLVFQGPGGTFTIDRSRYKPPQQGPIACCVAYDDLICLWASVDRPPVVYRLTPPQRSANSAVALVKEQEKKAKEDLKVINEAVQKGMKELRAMNTVLRDLTARLDNIRGQLAAIGIPTREGCLALYQKRDFDGWAQMLINLSDADICSMEEEIVALSKLENDMLTCPTRVDLIYRLVDVLSEGTLSLAPPLWKICCKGDPKDPFFAFGLREVATTLTRKAVELYPRGARSPKIRNALQILGHMGEAARLK